MFLREVSPAKTNSLYFSLHEELTINSRGKDIIQQIPEMAIYGQYENWVIATELDLSFLSKCTGEKGQQMNINLFYSSCIPSVAPSAQALRL